MKIYIIYNQYFIKWIFMIFLFLAISIGYFQLSFAMEKVDGISAVVGDEIILESEVKKRNPGVNPSQRLHQLIFKKLMIYHAKRDPSIEINEKELKVETNLMFLDKINQYENKNYLFEDKKNVKEFFNRIRDKVRNDMYIKQLYTKIVGNIDISPEEIKYFIKKHKNFNRKDPKKVYAYFLIFFIKKHKIQHKKILNFLKKIKKRMKKGMRPAILFKYPFSRFFSCKEISLKKLNINTIPNSYKKLISFSKENEIFGPFENDSKFYLMKLKKKEKNIVDIDYISIQEKDSQNNYFKIKSFLEFSKKMVLKNCIKFEDIGLKNQYFKNYFQYKHWINEDQLPKKIKKMLNTIKKGEITSPFFWNFYGKKSCCIIKLIDRIKLYPFLSDQDLKKIENIIREIKKRNAMENWYHKMINKTYVNIYSKI